ncbi:DUF6940 family protein [Anatilimnocola floriformis]|uniref:DUF6940 family protein n=1 Tax=Anatilimnocola floriformis TaxID=2948575 RepID=UPI0020C39C17|nr:hypothetical protein [Anatilimnocola floriformis]
MPEWSATRELVRAGTEKYQLQIDGRDASFEQVIAAWQNDATFRTWFNQLLAAVPYPSFRWETPPVTQQTIHQPFEFVVHDSPGLAPRPERDAFAEHFYRAAEDESVVTFANLGRNAVLVAPVPLAADKHYPHLGAFVRGAPAEQRDRLWQCVGNAMQERINAEPVWLSTAGAGVYWLHVRLDNSPKYYQHQPYRE